MNLFRFEALLSDTGFCTAIGNLTFQCPSGGQQFTYKYEHNESVKSFQQSIAAVVNKNLDNDLLRSEFYCHNR